MVAATGLLIVGLVLLVGGGEALLRGAVGVATLARLTPAVIGLTVVAAGTSVPELAVSAVASARGQADITVGNVVGSNIFNVTFILGLAAVIRPLAISGNTIRLEYPVLLLVTLAYLAVAQDGAVNALDAAFLLAVYVGFTAYLVSLVRGQMTAAERAQFGGEAASLTPDGGTPRPRWWVSLGLVAAGVTLLSLGASATVEGAADIGRALGLSERLIGLTIVSIGTGLPEVVTSVVSSARGRDDVAIGNVIGSNLFNTLVILGVTGGISPLPISPDLIRSDHWWLLGVTVGLFPLMATGMRVNRWEGALLLTVYGVYLTLLLGRG
jgi:cation:H+ antiporter